MLNKDNKEHVSTLKCALNSVRGALRPCIPNLNSKVQVGTSFLRFSKFDFKVIFCNYQKVRNRTNSEYSVNLECSETPVFDPKTWDLTQTYFAKFSRVWKDRIFPNYSETRENEKFRKFRLLQGLRVHPSPG